MAPIRQKEPKPRPSIAHIYHPHKSDWLPFQTDSHENEWLKRGELLKIVSWNIDHFSPGVPARTAAALRHLEEQFGSNPDLLVVMFQEVGDGSLHTMMEDPWVRDNFILSNTKPPESIYTEIEIGKIEWEARPYFTLMMTPRRLKVSRFFRVPFVTTMGRDALFVDIPVSKSGDISPSNDMLRLCTTHLESMACGSRYRPGQLGLISSLLKEEKESEYRVVAGLVGGDMNSIYKTEHELHKARRIKLKDVWEDVPPPVPVVLEPGQKDLTYGRARGNTWSYQSGKRRQRKRLDKFLYTGMLKTVSTEEAQDICGTFGRLGMGVKTQVEAEAAPVSDHFGITVGVRVG